MDWSQEQYTNTKCIQKKMCFWNCGKVPERHKKDLILREKQDVVWPEHEAVLPPFGKFKNYRQISAAQNMNEMHINFILQDAFENCKECGAI